MTGKVNTRSPHDHSSWAMSPPDEGLAAVDLTEDQVWGAHSTDSTAARTELTFRQQAVPTRSAARRVKKKSVGCGAFFSSWASPSPSTKKRPVAKPRRKSEADKEALRQQLKAQIQEESSSEEELDVEEEAPSAAEVRRRSEADGEWCRSRSRSPLQLAHRHSVPLPGAGERSRRGQWCDGRQRRVLRLVDDLLLDIYRHRRSSVDSDSGSSVLPPRPHVDSRLHLRSEYR
ncbi:uncharacterized protein LOC126110057 [Schistocerca cancellata]|uniref:uncharacterized protein LOC126110057 n=1 Tax=Schistocerca cancellata TaxID=274614 RepID=UPI00211823DE|nr:uncharacterized protein LOC126110057 [Schistocerca cancellata]